MLVAFLVDQVAVAELDFSELAELAEPQEAQAQVDQPGQLLQPTLEPVEVAVAVPVETL